MLSRRAPIFLFILRAVSNFSKEPSSAVDKRSLVAVIYFWRALSKVREENRLWKSSALACFPLLSFSISLWRFDFE